MKFLTLSGKTKNVVVGKYLVDWDAESKSKFQFDVKRYLYKYWQGDTVTEEFPVVGTKMRVDFLNISKKIAVEVNGDQHSQIHWFHGHEPANYQAQLIRDVKKERWCEKNGYKFVEIYSRDMPLTEKFFLERYEIKL